MLPPTGRGRVESGTVQASRGFVSTVRIAQVTLWGAWPPVRTNPVLGAAGGGNLVHSERPDGPIQALLELRQLALDVVKDRFCEFGRGRGSYKERVSSTPVIRRTVSTLFPEIAAESTPDSTRTSPRSR